MKHTKIIAGLIGLLLTLTVITYAQEDLSTLPLDQIQSRAESGEAAAQVELGNRYFYENESNLEQDFDLSKKWYLKAAEQDYPYGYIGLGNLEACACGDDIKLVKAFEWYLKAAEQNVPEAQGLVGSYYFKGHGVEVDYEKAMH
jgi:uncharacterized protein